MLSQNYHQTSNISSNFVGNKLIDHSDVIGASHVGVAPTTSSFLAWLQWIGQRQLEDEELLAFGVTYIWGLTINAK